MSSATLRCAINGVADDDRLAPRRCFCFILLHPTCASGRLKSQDWTL